MKWGMLHIDPSFECQGKIHKLIDHPGVRLQVFKDDNLELDEIYDSIEAALARYDSKITELIDEEE